MRAAAFAPEVARLLGVRVGRMLTLGWALAAMAGALAGVLVAPSVFLGPNSFDPILISGFVAAVLGGLDSPPGAVIGGLVLGLALSYVSGYEGSALVPLAALVILVVVLMVRPTRAVLGHQGAARMTVAASSAALRRAARCCARSLVRRWSRCVILLIVSDSLSAYRNLQLADGAYYFAVLAGLTVLAGSSGQISLGHGALMAVGRVHGRAADRQRGVGAVPGAGRARSWSRAGRGSGRRRREPAARAVPGGRHARVRGRAAGAGRQVPGARSAARTG